MVDAKTYAEFGADYLKYDACAASADYQLHAYQVRVFVSIQ